MSTRVILEQRYLLVSLRSVSQYVGKNSREFRWINRICTCKGVRNEPNVEMSNRQNMYC